MAEDFMKREAGDGSRATLTRPRGLRGECGAHVHILRAAFLCRRGHVHADGNLLLLAIVAQTAALRSSETAAYELVERSARCAATCAGR